MIIRRIATASTFWVSVALLFGTHCCRSDSPQVIATSDSAGTVIRARRNRRRRKVIEQVYGVHKAPLSEKDIVNTFAGVLPERRKSDLELHLLQDEEDMLWRQMGGAKMSMDPTQAPNATPTNGGNGGGGDGGGGDPTQAPNAAPTNGGGGGGGDGSPTASPDASPSTPTIHLSPTASPDATPSTPSQPSESPAEAPPNATPTPDGSGGGGGGDPTGATPSPSPPPSSDGKPAALPSTEVPTLRTLAPTPAPSDASGSNRIVVASSVGGVVLLALLFCVGVFTCEFKKGAGV